MEENNEHDQLAHGSGSSADNSGQQQIVIVGAGISGLCLAIRLKKAGIDSFVILEKSDEVGGTWLDNSYPGCGCDVPSILYSYSFAPKYDWSRKFAPQPEILDYFRHCAVRFDVRRHIRFGVSVSSAAWDQDASVWRIETDGGEQLVADAFVSAVGQLSRPAIPNLNGAQSFAGPAFHSARWDHDLDVAGKCVAVIGNGASAIQLIPKVAETASKVSVFQRSANWILPRHDYRYPRWLQAVFGWVPGVARCYRWWTYLLYELRILCYQRKTFLNNGMTWWARRQMSRVVPEEVKADVIPRYPAGCKRVLLSNDYLQSLHRDNVELVTDEIQHLEPEGIATDKGVIPVDAIVYATGFESTRFLYPMDISGRNGIRISEKWEDRPLTYLGMMAPGFPNFFMLYGPNTNLGHNSIIFMVECQVNYIMRCLRLMNEKGRTLEVRTQATEEFDETLQKQLRKKVWSGFVTNWYKNADGFIVNNWSGSTLAYWWATRRPDWDAFELTKRGRKRRLSKRRLLGEVSRLFNAQPQAPAVRRAGAYGWALNELAISPISEISRNSCQMSLEDVFCS